MSAPGVAVSEIFHSLFVKSQFQSQRFESMILEFGIVTTIVGSMLALYASRRRSIILEACAGVLLIAGLSCIGAGLPRV
ncbi:hypothetical protein E3H11_09040 [Bradyrhizobium brasilense]|uniref:hypothetical protein n=1 Tax=Bradyrhizobium brasilense TaxID=1419277 RepID=UPI0014570098|nr:hypothetical protein [Bradyrhizobium brasilense]NLS69064.1 hypothetical protein [Bradyrhizobium brasilense]